MIGLAVLQLQLTTRCNKTRELTMPRCNITQAHHITLQHQTGSSQHAATSHRLITTRCNITLAHHNTMQHHTCSPPDQWRLSLSTWAHSLLVYQMPARHGYRSLIRGEFRNLEGQKQASPNFSYRVKVGPATIIRTPTERVSHSHS